VDSGPPDSGCVHNGCTGPCMDNCGGNPACCPDSGPPDAGCHPLGSSCTANSQCCPPFCANTGGAGTCEAMCIPSGNPCGPFPCCYPATCTAGPVVMSPLTPGGPDGGPLEAGMGTCL
jgi:hypothetical protein